MNVCLLVLKCYLSQSKSTKEIKLANCAIFAWEMLLGKNLTTIMEVSIKLYEFDFSIGCIVMISTGETWFCLCFCCFCCGCGCSKTSKFLFWAKFGRPLQLKTNLVKKKLGWMKYNKFSIAKQKTWASSFLKCHEQIHLKVPSLCVTV